MIISTTDIILLVVIVSSLVVGFFWGAARSLMGLGAWLFAFMVGAYLQYELGSYLAGQWTNFPPAFGDMAAFGLIFVGIMAATPFFILITTRGTNRISRYQVLDDIGGALVSVAVSVLFIAGLLIIFGTFYGTGTTLIESQGGPEWTANMYQSLLNSNIGSIIDEHIVPLIGTVLGPILPADVREVAG